MKVLGVPLEGAQSRHKLESRARTGEGGSRRSQDIFPLMPSLELSISLLQAAPSVVLAAGG